MPDTTPALAIPYPLPGDPVTDYPTTGRELAELLASLIGGVSRARTVSVASNGSDFASSPGVFPGGLPFTADGVSSYELQISSRVWFCNVDGATVAVAIDLDGVDVGEIASAVHPAGVGDFLNARGIIATPAAGPHVAQVRLYHYGPAGTATILGGTGAAGDNGPILGTLRPILPTFYNAADLLERELEGEPLPTEHRAELA